MTQPQVISVVFLLALFNGCGPDGKLALGPGFGTASSNPYEDKKRLTTFQEAQFEPFKGQGTSTLSGEAFMRTRGGDVKLGAGLEVFLYPVTDYTTEMMQREVLGTERLEPMDERLAPFVRSTRANSRGEFEFAKLPPGEYYLLCLIQWEVYRVTTGPVPTFYRNKLYLTPGYYSYMDASGGWAYAKAKVVENEPVKVIVTR